MKNYKHWEVHECLPDGYKRDKSTGSPLQGYDFAANGSPLKGGKRILVRADNPKAIGQKEVKSAQPDSSTDNTKSKRTLSKDFVIDGTHVKTVNELARQKFKQRLLNDIMCDLMICEIEGWCKSEYIKELRDLICKIGLPICVEAELSNKIR